MNREMAIESVGRAVLLVKDNKVIGEGYSTSSVNYEVGIEMRDDRAKAFVAESDLVRFWQNSQFTEKAFNYAVFHFDMWTGTFRPRHDEEDFAPMGDVRVVDKQKFEWGAVPDEFKAVEGYRSYFNSPEKMS